ncbi:NUDIX hydrolase [Nocardia brasiliensis]|uniref:NUDIX hydrolase n=1 Tax=Nocardia brasiliensis TaxID=37326 RepID=UPI0004A6C24D|nr:NUDIX domain-containing protein [Nocardia brasiliensis]
MTIFRTIVGVQLLLIENGRVLLARRRNTGFADGQWNAPGGKLDEGEDVLTAIIREADEEIGVQLERDDVDLVASIHIQHPPGQTRIVFVFRARNWSGEPYNREPGSCSELRWFPLDELPDNTIQSTRAGLDLYRRGENFGVYGWPEPSLIGDPR